MRGLTMPGFTFRPVPAQVDPNTAPHWLQGWSLAVADGDGRAQKLYFSLEKGGRPTVHVSPRDVLWDIRWTRGWTGLGRQLP